MTDKRGHRQSTKPLWQSGIVLAAFLVLSVVGCGRTGKTRTENAETDPRVAAERKEVSARARPAGEPATVDAEGDASAQTSASSSRPANIPLAALQLPGDTLLAEVAQANWESEALGDAAAARLNELCSLLVRSQSLANDEMALFCDPTSSCGLLRPDALSTVYRDDSFTVLRASEHTLNGEAAATGAAGLTEALNSWFEPLRSSRDLRVEQKVIRVEIENDKFKTTSLVHLTGKTDEGAIQLNTTWQCAWRESAEDQLTLLSLHCTDYEEIRTHRGEESLFADCTQSVLGADPYWQQILSYSLDHWLDRIETRYGLDAAGWQGIAVGDVNGDGLDDVYVCQPGGIPNAMLVQSPDGTARDIAEQAGVNLYDQTHSALLVDLDDDGDQDLVLAISMGVTIFANDGQGTFTPQTAKLFPQAAPFSLSAADYDLDGDLDLYACCYSKRRSVVDHQFLGRPLPYHDANNGARNVLLRNNRDWQFQDVTKRVGLSQNNQRFSFAAAWEDYDNDGDLDLYVANDYGRNNLYRNDGQKFVDVAPQTGVEDMSAGMSVSWGDVDNDGWMDLYVSNMFSSAGNRVAYQREFQPEASAETRAGFQRHARGNSLFVNSGGGGFRDVSVQAAVTMGRWAWGSGLADLNNDGLKDIVVANGFLTQDLPDDL